MKPLKHMLYSIGNTPTVALGAVSKPLGSIPIYAKLEYFNPTGSITDRAALSLIKDARTVSEAKEKTVIIDAVLGNMGPSIAYVSRMLGHKCIITAPDSISEHNKRTITSLGATLVLTDRRYGIDGAIKKAESIWNQTKDSYMLRQFTNDAAVDAYRTTLGPELYETFGDNLGFVFCGVGSGNTLTGTAEYLKSWVSDVQIIAVEPFESAVLSGKYPGPHGIDGIGIGFTPSNYNPYVVDKIMTVRTGDAEAAAKTLFKAEGIPCGISSGAVMCAALEYLSQNKTDRAAVLIMPDGAYRYRGRNIF